MHFPWNKQSPTFLDGTKMKCVPRQLVVPSLLLYHFSTNVILSCVSPEKECTLKMIIYKLCPLVIHRQKYILLICSEAKYNYSELKKNVKNVKHHCAFLEVMFCWINRRVWILPEDHKMRCLVLKTEDQLVQTKYGTCVNIHQENCI